MLPAAAAGNTPPPLPRRQAIETRTREGRSEKIILLFPPNTQDHQVTHSQRGGKGDTERWAERPRMMRMQQEEGEEEDHKVRGRRVGAMPPPLSPSSPFPFLPLKHPQSPTLLSRRKISP